ncbi:MAG: hypothetical protein NC117_09995 [Pseudoflavonifractor sp.]|nr:hypothetical protein [Pseudoflavonifractor sp.]
MSEEKKLNRIKVGGRELPCRVTMGAMVRFKRETGKDARQFSADDLEEVITFLWCCVVSSCRADKISDPPALDDFADLLEPTDLEAFYSSMGADVEVKKTTPPAAMSTTEA